MIRQNYTIGSRIKCPLGCNTDHVILLGYDSLSHGQRENGELQSICMTVKNRSKDKASRILWSFGELPPAQDVDVLYQAWRDEIFRQAENYYGN